MSSIHTGSLVAGIAISKFYEIAWAEVCIIWVTLAVIPTVNIRIPALWVPACRACQVLASDILLKLWRSDTAVSRQENFSFSLVLHPLYM